MEPKTILSLGACEVLMMLCCLVRIINEVETVQSSL
jgi:hypothetical protein